MSEHSEPSAEAKLLHRLDEFLTDIGTLLDYLSRLDNGRLQAHFDDTRSAVTAAVQFRAQPPCKSYAGFLARLTYLATKIRREQWSFDSVVEPSGAPPMPPGPTPGATPGATMKRSDAGARQAPARDGVPPAAPGGAIAVPPNGERRLDDLSFLIWSRDFLAAVAAPATVESIEITRAFVQARIHGGMLRRAGQWLRRLLPEAPTSRARTAATAGDAGETGADLSVERADRKVFGRMLSATVGWLEISAVLAVCAALGASTYALSGHSLLDQQKSALASYGKLDYDIEAIVASAATVSNGQDKPQSGDMPRSIEAACGQNIRPDQANATLVAAAAFVPELQPRWDGSGQDAVTRSVVMLNYLCEQRAQVVGSERMIEASLQSWFHPIAYPTRVLGFTGVSVGPLFGYNPNWATESGVRDRIEKSGIFARSALDAVALYLMPCLYGLIGAMAATMRTVRRKVDGSTLNYTDRGRVRQDMLLGVMCGATIGLFASYISGATATQDLGLSALALLAGYNVPGVLGLFDELSGRLFRPAETNSVKG
jgi:hypothetical protein